jgi:hypothetical protein
MDEVDENVKELCKRASTESDRGKLLEFVSQIIEALVDREKNRTAPMQDGGRQLAYVLAAATKKKII